MPQLDPELDPDWVVRPGVILEEVMDDWHLSPKVTAHLLNLEVHELEAILSGYDRISTAVARRLEAAFGISVEFWLNLERVYREGLAAGKKATDA